MAHQDSLRRSLDGGWSGAGRAHETGSTSTSENYPIHLLSRAAAIPESAWRADNLIRQRNQATFSEGGQNTYGESVKLAASHQGHWAEAGAENVEGNSHRLFFDLARSDPLA